MIEKNSNKVYYCFRHNRIRHKNGWHYVAPEFLLELQSLNSKLKIIQTDCPNCKWELKAKLKLLAN